MKKEKHNGIGSSFDDFLKEEGIYDSCMEEAIRKVKEAEENERLINGWSKGDSTSIIDRSSIIKDNQ